MCPPSPKTWVIQSTAVGVSHSSVGLNSSFSILKSVYWELHTRACVKTVHTLLISARLVISTSCIEEGILSKINYFLLQNPPFSVLRMG